VSLTEGGGEGGGRGLAGRGRAKRRMANPEDGPAQSVNRAKGSGQFLSRGLRDLGPTGRCLDVSVTYSSLWVEPGY